jgi:hypothetical protein
VAVSTVENVRSRSKIPGFVTMKRLLPQQHKYEDRVMLLLPLLFGSTLATLTVSFSVLRTVRYFGRRCAALVKSC